MKLDWLIDMDNLSLSSDKKNFMATEDNISANTFGIKSLYGDKVSFELDLEKEKDKMPPLYLDNNSISKRKDCNTAQTTKETIEGTQDIVVQDIQSIRGYSKPPILE